MRRFVLNLDFVLKSRHMESNSGELVTVPDESYTMQELVRRFTKGLDMGVTRSVAYSSEDGSDVPFDAPDLHRLRDMDLVDREEYSRSLAKDREVMASTLASRDALSKAAAEAAAAEDKEIREAHRQAKSKKPGKESDGPKSDKEV